MVTSSTEPKDDALYNVFSAGCPTRDTLDLIGDKWSVMVVLLLGDSALRFGRLRRSIEGISQKMLTQTLRNLERNGLVDRRVYATTPPSVEYSLTPLGETLTATLQQLNDWAEAYIESVLAARQAFDGRNERELVE